MQAVKNKDRSRLIAAAMQQIPCDLTVENVKFVNVITGEIYPASVDILDGIVVRVREEGETTETPSKETYDAQGRYMVPGFIDTHLHIESTMMVPENFARAVARCGSTAVMTDPHEIGNVMGIDGVKFMIDNAKQAPIRVYTLTPSCVPSVVGAEGSGASFEAKDIKELFNEDNVIGVAEVMDFIGVINDVPRMHDIVQAGMDAGLFIQGHAPGLTGKELVAYKIAGPVSCHESRVGAEVRQKLRMGMHVNLQSSSLSLGLLPELIKGTEGMRWKDNVSICTDDIHAKDILETGHINRVIKHALALGVDPIDAIRYATYNPAREFGFTDMGAIAPGYVADFQLLDELDGRNPKTVFVGGKVIVEDYELVDDHEPKPLDFPNTVKLSQVTGKEVFCLKAPEGCGDTVKTAVMTTDGTIMYHLEYEDLPVKDGYVDISADPNLCFVALCNRHGASDMTVAVYRGFGLEKGAVASTISHDCHNFTVVFKKPEDAYAAAKELERVGGGITAVENGQIISTLELPVAGLMSDLPAEKVAVNVEKTEKAIATLCYGKEGMLLKTAVMALACLPCVVITDRGLWDGLHSKFCEPFQL